jgi:trigger factor
MATTTAQRKLWTALSCGAALAVVAVAIAGCGGDTTTITAGGESESATAVESATASAAAATAPADFSYSDGIDENGYWDGVTAKDLVELYDYKAFPIPAATHEITDEAVQSEVDSMLSSYSTTEQVTDRAVVDGDTVGIDYVGSVGGVEFDGGSTGGAGTEVTIGVTSYIDDFLEQLIGHSPGETFDINVTFPEDYGVDNLNGQDAVFVTTINYVVNTVTPELTDAFVAENLSAQYGWTTVAELRDGIRANLQKTAIQNYIYDYLSNDVTVKSVPEELLQHQEDAMLYYYEQSAVSYALTLEEFLQTYVGYDSVDDLIDAAAEDNRKWVEYTLIIQAIAEEEDITADDDDLAAYFTGMGISDYTQYETEYGLPYLKQSALTQKVMDYLAEHAVLE